MKVERTTMDTGLDLLKPEIDTAVFSSRRWYVAGFGRFWFTSKEDAKAAIDLARVVAGNERKAVTRHVRDFLDDL